MYSVKFTPKALADLQSIANYIALDNPKRAISFIDELQLKTNSFLVNAPNGGSPYKNKTRYFPVGNYIILYEVNDLGKFVDVLHIVSARTDWRRSD